MMKRSYVVNALFALAALSGATAAAPILPEAVPSSTNVRIIMLGTAGGPIARRTRSQPASILLVNGKPYVIDMGDNVTEQLVRAGFRPRDIDTIFLTHLHPDHTLGIAPFMASDWVDRRVQPVTIFGPPGTAQILRGAKSYLQLPELSLAPSLIGYPSISSLFRAHEFNGDGPTEIYRDANVRVTAVDNTHYVTLTYAARRKLPSRSYSYRFEAAGRTVVFTGDTGPSVAVENLARGADVLVSEVVDIPAITAQVKRSGEEIHKNLSPLAAHMQQEHLSPQAVGELATRAGVKMVILTHFVGPEGPNMSDYLDGVRRSFKGRVIASQDLEIF